MDSVTTTRELHQYFSLLKGLYPPPKVFALDAMRYSALFWNETYTPFPDPTTSTSTSTTEPWEMPTLAPTTSSTSTTTTTPFPV